ncbi:MAG: hypothetical protein J7J51_00775, partial [Candidatus Omnitrophica bacterium]|nr:hypothetical protein [Candidatus Omnitrophota bacterium]
EIEGLEIKEGIINKIELNVDEGIKSSSGDYEVGVDLSALSDTERKKFDGATFAVIVTRADVAPGEKSHIFFTEDSLHAEDTRVKIIVHDLSDGIYKNELVIYDKDPRENEDYKMSKLDEVLYKQVEIDKTADGEIERLDTPIVYLNGEQVKKDTEITSPSGTINFDFRYKGDEPWKLESYLIIRKDLTLSERDDDYVKYLDPQVYHKKYGSFYDTGADLEGGHLIDGHTYEYSVIALGENIAKSEPSPSLIVKIDTEEAVKDKVEINAGRNTGEYSGTDKGYIDEGGGKAELRFSNWNYEHEGKTWTHTETTGAEPDMDALPDYSGSNGERITIEGKGDWVWSDIESDAAPDMDALPERSGLNGERVSGDGGDWVWSDIEPNMHPTEPAPDYVGQQGETVVNLKDRGTWVWSDVEGSATPDMDSLPDRPGAYEGERVSDESGAWVWKNNEWIWQPWTKGWNWQPWTKGWNWQPWTKGWKWEPHTWKVSHRSYDGDNPEVMEVKIIDTRGTETEDDDIKYDSIFIDVNYSNPQHYYDEILQTYVETNPVLQHMFADGTYEIKARFWEENPKNNFDQKAPGEWSTFTLKVEQPWWNDRSSWPEMNLNKDLIRPDKECKTDGFYVGLESIPLAAGIDYYEVQVDTSGKGFTDLENKDEWITIKISAEDFVKEKKVFIPIQGKEHLIKKTGRISGPDGSYDYDYWSGKYSVRMRAVREDADPFRDDKEAHSPWLHLTKKIAVPDKLFVDEDAIKDAKAAEIEPQVLVQTQPVVVKDIDFEKGKELLTEIGEEVIKDAKEINRDREEKKASVVSILEENLSDEKELEQAKDIVEAEDYKALITFLKGLKKEMPSEAFKEIEEAINAIEEIDERKEKLLEDLEKRLSAKEFAEAEKLLGDITTIEVYQDLLANEETLSEAKLQTVADIDYAKRYTESNQYLSEQGSFEVYEDTVSRYYDEDGNLLLEIRARNNNA